MPSVFDLFGTLRLDTADFDGAVRRVKSTLEDADSNLNKVISTSNKLGDTSAVVARRQEKLAEGLTIQNQRLTAASGAFERGELTAKEYGRILASVATQADSFGSRIKDAAAQVRELDETGLTHFQNRIQGAVAQTATLNGLFRNLTAFQKQQLGFQLNDIISGLASGQNPMQILAQQGGQIVQVFQQGKLAQEGVVVATNAAVAAETELVSVSQLQNTTVAGSVNQMLAFRKETEGAAAAGGLLNTSLVAIGAVLAAGIVTILTAKKASEDVLASAQKRLATEEAIAGALNKQSLALKEFQDRLKNEQGDRAFNRFLEGGGSESVLRDLQGRYNELYKKPLDEAFRRGVEADNLGLTNKAKIDYVHAPILSKEQQDDRKRLEDQISQLTARLEQDKYDYKQKFPYGVSAQFQLDTANFGQKYAEAVAKQQADNARKALEHQERLAEAQKRAAEMNIASAEEFKRKVESLTKVDAGRFDRSLDAYRLRREAQEFQQGYKFGPQSIGERLQAQLNALGGSFGTSQVLAGIVSGGSLGESKIYRTVANLSKLTDAQKEAYYKDVVKLTDNLSPEDLTSGQRSLAAQARRYLADKDDEETKDAFKKLTEAIKTGAVIHIVDDSNGRAKIETRPTGANTASFYPSNQ